jgi:hypothetical protein
MIAEQQWQYCYIHQGFVLYQRDGFFMNTTVRYWKIVAVMKIKHIKVEHSNIAALINYDKQWQSITSI